MRELALPTFDSTNPSMRTRFVSALVSSHLRRMHTTPSSPDIGDEGAEAIGVALRIGVEHTKLTALWLGYNNIGDLVRT